MLKPLYSNMLTIMFGTRTYSASDPLVQRLLHLGTEFMQLTGKPSTNIFCISRRVNCPAGPWSNAIDFFEPLQKIPTSMRSRGRKLHNEFMEVNGTMITQVKARMDTGDDISDCLVKTLIESREAEKLSWKDMCFIIAAFTTGGVHSVRLILPFFIRELKLITAIDLWNHHMVPGSHHITSRGSNQSS